MRTLSQSLQEVASISPYFKYGEDIPASIIIGYHGDFHLSWKFKHDTSTFPSVETLEQFLDEWLTKWYAERQEHEATFANWPSGE